jgi:hypothetical protein
VLIVPLSLLFAACGADRDAGDAEAAPRHPGPARSNAVPDASLSGSNGHSPRPKTPDAALAEAAPAPDAAPPAPEPDAAPPAPEPDAAPPAPEPDAAPPAPEPDAATTPVEPDAATPPVEPDAALPLEPDAGPLDRSANTSLVNA